MSNEKQFLRGFTKFSLAPYAPSSYAIFLFGLTKEEMISHLTTSKSELFNTQVKDLKTIKKISEHMQYLKDRFGDFKEYNEFYNKDIGTAHFYDFYKKCNFYLVIVPQIDISRLKEVKYVSELQLTISHEALHVCQYILPQFLDRNEEMEAEAYFHQNLTKKVIDEVLSMELDYTL